MSASTSNDPQQRERVLVLATTDRLDLSVCQVLRRAGFACSTVASLADLEAEASRGVGIFLLSAEDLTPEAIGSLSTMRRRVAGVAASLPMIVVAGPDDGLPSVGLETLGSILLLEQPVRPRELLRMAQAALQISDHQRQIERRLRRRDQTVTTMRRRQRRLQGILDAGTIGIVLRQADGTIVEANDYFLRLVGYSRQELKDGTLRWADITSPECRLADRQAAEELRRTGVTAPFEKEYVRRDGARVPAMVSLAALPGSADHVVASVLDMTAHIRAEESLRQHEQAYQRLFDNRLNGMARGRVIVDEAGQIADIVLLEVNDALGQILGTGQEPLTGRPIFQTFPMLRESCFEHFRLCGQVAVTSEEGRFEFFQEHLHRWYSAYVYSPRSGEFIAILADITERKQSEEQMRERARVLEQRVAERTAEAERQAVQLRRLAEELIQAEERERRRLAQVLHDHLQQLLVGARLGVSPLVKRLAGQELGHAARQVDDLLRQSIATSRSLTAELSPPVLYDAGLPQALHWLAGWMHDKHGLTVEVEADGRVNPQEKVRILLFQAIRELLFNVVKHSGTQRSRVRLARRKDQARILVEDEGSGFDPQEATVGRPDRAGFGLFSIRQRLEWLGGALRIDSRPGAGCRIELLAPLHLPEAEPESLAQDASLSQVLQQAAAKPPALPPAGTARVRVLLVDDHPVLRDGLAQLLGAETGIEVIGQAGDGREAVELAVQLRPDVVLMDVSLPGLSGIEATRAIRSHLPGTQVIGLSMHTELGMAAAMREAGACDYLAKSTDPARLIDAIRACPR